MEREIPVEYRDLLTKKAFAHLATLMPDGTPQVTPVWFDEEGHHLRVNSAVGRLKDRNIRRDPRVSLSIMDPDNPYRYLEVRGRVVEITEMGAESHIDALTKKYMGLDRYPFHQPGVRRVIYKIEPRAFSSMG